MSWECVMCKRVERDDSNPHGWDVTVLSEIENFKIGEKIYPVCRDCALRGFDNVSLKNNDSTAYGDYIAGGNRESWQDV